jgi:hypothetical protein
MSYPLAMFIILLIDFAVVVLKIKYAQQGPGKKSGAALLNNTHPVVSGYTSHIKITRSKLQFPLKKQLFTELACHSKDPSPWPQE